MSQAFKCDVCTVLTEGEARGTVLGWCGVNKTELCPACAKQVADLLESRRPKREVAE